MAKKGNLLVRNKETGEFSGFFCGEFLKIDKDGKFMKCREVTLPMNEKGAKALAEIVKQMRGY